MTKTRKIIVIAIIFAIQAIGSFHVALANQYSYGNAGRPALPWNYLEDVDDLVPYIFMNVLSQDMTGYYMDDYGSKFLVTGVDNTAKFYIDGDQLKASQTTYFGSWADEDNGTYQGWSTSDCNGGIPGMQACVASGGSYILDMGDVDVMEEMLATSFHLFPIYTDNTYTTVAYAPNYGQNTYFQSPEDGNVSHDFKTWWVCSYIPVPDGMTHYNLEVLYGEVGDGFTFSDATADAIGAIPIYDEEVIDECPLIAKSENLTPGDWHAQINLLDQDDNVIAASQEITFTITAGDQVDFANDGQIARDKYVGCDEYGNAVQRQGCKLMVFLLYPDDGFIQGQLADMHDILFAQAPFAYFETIQTQVDGIDTDATSPDVSISLTNPFGEAHASTLDFDLLTDDNPVLGDNLDTIRPWIVTGLWLGFALYLFFRIFHIFKGV